MQSENFSYDQAATGFYGSRFELKKRRKRKYKIRTHRCKQIPQSESTSNKRVIVVKLHSFRKEKSQSHRDKIDDSAMT